MMRLLALPLLCVPSLVLAAPSLSIEGDCPGTMEIEVTDVDGPRFGLAWGMGEGEEEAGLWYCGATATGLSEVGGVKYFRASFGSATLTPTVPDGVCGMYVQAFDLSSCEASAVMPMAGGGGAGEYIGSYDVGDGPSWSDDVMPLSCLGGCAENFGGVAEDYQCSTSDSEIDNQGYYSGWGDGTYCTEPAEESWVVGDHTSCGDSGCYYSAWVADHCFGSINHCWTR